MVLHRRLPAPALAMLAVLPWLSGCSDTIVFGAQREIDVAISLNEDVAEPVQVNIGLNSQIAALIAPIGEKEDEASDGVGTASTAPVEDQLLRQFKPEGEAASIFSGFHYISSSMLEPAKPKYDAEIRSQFASGAAAILLASSPKAVSKVVDVGEIALNRQAGFLDEDVQDLRAVLNEKVDTLPSDKVTVLYKNPPTTDPAIEVPMLTSGVLERCKTDPECQLNVTHTRLNNVKTLEELRLWERLINS